MPLYDYRCSDCGEFRAWRSMREAAAPVACPDCQQSAPRAVVAPNLALMNAHARTAHQRNEKSAHEPNVVSRSGQGTITPGITATATSMGMASVAGPG